MKVRRRGDSTVPSFGSDRTICFSGGSSLTPRGELSVGVPKSVPIYVDLKRSGQVGGRLTYIGILNGDVVGHLDSTWQGRLGWIGCLGNR